MHKFFGLVILMLTFALLVGACGGTNGTEDGSDESGQPEPSLGSQTGTDAEGPDTGGSGKSGSTGGRGKEIFTQSCATCHTLSDANAAGTVGPNLDDLQPDKDQTIEAIEAGPGVMPENLVEGDDAEAVADYVAEVTAG